MTASRNAYIKDIQETCALAGKPERAQAFIASNTAAADVRSKLLGERVDLVADMRRRHGIGDQPQANIKDIGNSVFPRAPVVDLVAEMKRLHGITN